jgi:hypothetical protein
VLNFNTNLAEISRQEGSQKMQDEIWRREAALQQGEEEAKEEVHI